MNPKSGKCTICERRTVRRFEGRWLCASCEAVVLLAGTFLRMYLLIRILTDPNMPEQIREIGDKFRRSIEAATEGE